MNEARDSRLWQAFGRLFDATCACAGLVFLVPVFTGLALAILWDDGPPVFFSQTRVGRSGKPFRIWKLRTMRSGSQGGVITAAGDGRVTRNSVLAAHLPGASDSDTGGVREATQAFFGSADHHGIYQEPTFQNLLLRMLLRRS